MGKGKDERVKREKIGRERIAVRDACKDAIVFFTQPTELWNVWLSKLSTPLLPRQNLWAPISLRSKSFRGAKSEERGFRRFAPFIAL